MSKSHQVFLSVNDGYGPIRMDLSNVPCTDPSGTVFRSEEGVLVFTAVHDAVMGEDPFVHKKDATGKWGVCPLVKLVACFRCIAYGDAHDRG